MDPAEEAADPLGPEIAEIREVVPARAVLTELARGFLLLHESNPDRAIRFAETFLRERSAQDEPDRTEATPTPTPARLRVGLSGRGAVDPTNFPVRR